MELLFNTKSLKLWKNQKWIFASRKDAPLNKDPDCAVIAAILNDCLVVISQLRHPIGEITYELPAGKIDPGESDIEAGTREFKEETGLKICAVNKIIRRCYASPGITDESASILLVQAEGKPSREFQKADENITIHLMNENEVKKLINNTPLPALNVNLALIGHFFSEGYTW